MGVLPQSHLSEVSFLLACNVLEKWNTLWLLCAVNEGRFKIIPMTFCCTCSLRKHMLSMVRHHSMKILKAYIQKFETGGFVDPGRNSRLQTGAQKKKNKSPVSSIFALALVLNGCSSPVLWVLSCLSSDFAYTLFLGNYSFQSWPQGRQLKSHIISSILSFTKFLSLGSCFWTKKLWWGQ